MPGAAPPLAQPSFFTGPQDSLATANPYTAAGGVVNSIQNQLSNLGVNIPDVLKGGAGLAAAIALSKKASLTVAVNPSALAARLMATVPGLSSAFAFLGDLESDASAVVSTALSAGQEALTAGMSAVGSVVATIGGVATTIETDAVTGLAQLGGVISAVTGGAVQLGIQDTQGMASVIGGLIGQVAGYGIPGAFGALTVGITDPGILSACVSISLPGVLKNNDLTSIASMVLAVGSGRMQTLSPQLILSLSSGYSRSGAIGGLAANSSAFDTSTFNTSMNTYSDYNPTWNTSSRDGVSTNDISSLTGASSDYTDMLSNGVMSLSPGDPLQDTALAGVYGPQDVMTSLQSDFPNTVMTTGTSAVTSSSASNSPATGGILDKLATLMPGLSLASGGAAANTYTQQLDAYNAGMAAINNGSYNPTGVPSPSPAPASTPIPAPAADVPMVYTAFGTMVPADSHSLLGYTATGKPEYADDPYNDGEILFPTPPQTPSP